MADAQWVLDIAAQMPDGAATIAELDKLTASLTGAGQRSESFQAAIKGVSEKLDVAAGASKRANEALAAGQEQYRLLEREALRAGKALERAQSGKVVPIEAFRQAKAAEAALASYGAEMKKLEDAAAGASSEHKALGSQLDKIRKLAGHVDQRNAALNQRYEKAGQLVGLLPGPLAQVGGTMLRSARASHELNVAFGASTAKSLLVAGAVAAVAVAVVALTAAMIAGAVAAAGYAIKLADTHREAGLTREAFAAMSVEGAAAVASFDQVAAATGATDETLLSLSKQLKSAKVGADDMQRALLAAATAELALGKGGASEFISEIAAGTKTVDEFAATVDASLGGVAAQRLRGLTAQAALAEKRWNAIFAGLNLDPVLDAVAVLTGMLDKSNPLAQAFGDAVSGAFKLVEKYALPAAYAVEAFALGFAIQLTKLYIAVRPALRWLSELFGFDDATLRTTLDLAGTAGKIAAGAFVMMAAAGAALVGIVGAIGAVFAAAVAAIVGFGAALFWVASHVWPVIFDAVSGVVELGKMIVMGLVEGITGAASFLYDAIRGAVTGAINTAKEVLGIASDSKVFAEIGGYTASGFSAGVDDGAGEARDSMAALVQSGATGSRVAAQTPAAEPAPARASASQTVDLSGATFVFNGVANAETAQARFAETLTAILEDDAASLAGARVEAA